VIQAWDGNFVVVGSSESLSDDPDIFIAVISGEGQMLWSRVIPHTGWQDFASSAVPLFYVWDRPKQEVPIAMVAGQLEMNPVRGERQGDIRTLVFQFCPEGICWAYLLNLPLEDGAAHLFMTEDEGYALSGYSFEFGIGLPALMLAKWSEKEGIWEGGLICNGESIALTWVDAPFQVTQVTVEPLPLQLSVQEVSLTSDVASFTVDSICTWICGDANEDLKVDPQDLMFLANYLFAGGPSPSHPLDPNEEDDWDINDLIYLANYLFGGGPSPCAM